jgi:hypothetical protein
MVLIPAEMRPNRHRKLLAALWTWLAAVLPAWAEGRAIAAPSYVSGQVAHGIKELHPEVLARRLDALVKESGHFDIHHTAKPSEAKVWQFELHLVRCDQVKLTNDVGVTVQDVMETAEAAARDGNPQAKPRSDTDGGIRRRAEETELTVDYELIPRHGPRVLAGRRHAVSLVITNAEWSVGFRKGTNNVSFRLPRLGPRARHSAGATTLASLEQGLAQTFRQLLDEVVIRELQVPDGSQPRPDDAKGSGQPGTHGSKESPKDGDGPRDRQPEHDGRPSEEISVAEYARQTELKESKVMELIEQGLLRARRDGDAWRIPVNAPPPPADPAKQL